MEGKAAARPAVGAAALAACMGALGALATGSGFAQALPEAAQQAAREGTEQRRAQEQLHGQNRLLPQDGRSRAAG